MQVLPAIGSRSMSAGTLSLSNLAIRANGSSWVDRDMVMRFLGGGVGHVDLSQYVPAEREPTTEAGTRGVDGDAMEGDDEMESEDADEGPDGGTEGLEAGTDKIGGDAEEPIGDAEEPEEGEEDQVVGMEEDSGHPDGEEVREGCDTDNGSEGDLQASDYDDDNGSLEGFGHD